MNNLKQILTLAFVCIILFQSCSIQKRRHLDGWHISIKKQNKSISKKQKAESPEITNAIEKKVVGSVQDEPMEKLFQNEKVILSDQEENTELQNNQITQTTTPKNSVSYNIESKNTIQVNKNIQPEKAKKNEKEVAEPWVPKMWGGILGVLLALIVLPFIFLVAFFLLGGDSEDFMLLVSSSDSTFKQSFKRVFNSVIKVGVSILFIAAIIIVIASIIISLYIEYGLIGAILGFLTLLLITLLLAFLFYRIFEFLLLGFGYDR